MSELSELIQLKDFWQLQESAREWLKGTRGSEKFLNLLENNRLRPLTLDDCGKVYLPCYILSYYRSGAITPSRQLVGAALSYIDVSPVGRAEVGIYVRATENPRLLGAIKRFHLGKGYILVLVGRFEEDSK